MFRTSDVLLFQNLQLWSQKDGCCLPVCLPTATFTSTSLTTSTTPDPSYWTWRASHGLKVDLTEELLLQNSEQSTQASIHRQAWLKPSPQLGGGSVWQLLEAKQFQPLFIYILGARRGNTLLPSLLCLNNLVKLFFLLPWKLGEMERFKSGLHSLVRSFGLSSHCVCTVECHGNPLLSPIICTHLSCLESCTDYIKHLRLHGRRFLIPFSFLSLLFA